MISKFQFQSLVLLLSLRESLHPTKIRQWQRNICVGFIPVECSPIGFCRFKSETFQFHHHSNGDSDFSKLNKRFQAQIWDPGGNVSDYKDGSRTRNRLWPNVNFVLHEEDTKRVVSETEINLLIRTGEKHSSLRKDILLITLSSMLWWFWRQSILYRGNKRNHRLLRLQNDVLLKPFEETTRNFQLWPLKNINKGIEIMDLSWVIFTTNIVQSPGSGDANVCVVSDVTDGSQPFDFHKKFWRYITEKIVQQENQNRLTTKTMKENNRLINLLACKAYQHPEATCFFTFSFISCCLSIGCMVCGASICMLIDTFVLSFPN